MGGLCVYNWEGKKVLVTGAGGFIGSHLMERLVKKGAEVTAFVRYNSRNDPGFLKLVSRETRDNVRIFYGDLKELETVKRAMQSNNIVFNLAALVGIPYSYIHPNEVIENNTIGTLHMLTAARDKGVEKFIQTSTSEVYGSARYVPIDEEHPKQPQSPYSASKISSDAIALSFYYAFDLPVTIIRPFNTYGPRQSARAVIPTIITQALISNTVKLGNQNTTRDFTFISDTVEGFVKIAESRDSIGEEINIGSGYEISISDLVRKICSFLRKDIKRIEDKSRIRPQKSEVKRLFCDNTKAQKLIQWRPKISLEEGLKITIEWIQKYIYLYEPDKYQK